MPTTRLEMVGNGLGRVNRFECNKEEYVTPRLILRSFHLHVPASERQAHLASISSTQSPYNILQMIHVSRQSLADRP